MAIGFSDPFTTLFKFQEALASLRDSPWLEPGTSGGGSYPPVNVFRKGDDLVIIAEVPGVRKEDLKIEIKGRTVRLAGSKSMKTSEKASIHRRERLSGTFDRMVTVPVEINADQVKAECRDGVLALWLPRAERDRPRSISVS